MAVGVVVFAVGVRWLAPGWFFLAGLFFYPFVVCGHCAAHALVLLRAGAITRQFMTRVLVSHALFAAAFLLQYDEGDGPGWFTITVLVRGWREGIFQSSLVDAYGFFAVLSWNILLFGPVAISWYTLLRRKPVPMERNAVAWGGGSPHCQVPEFQFGSRQAGADMTAMRECGA